MEGHVAEHGNDARGDQLLVAQRRGGVQRSTRRRRQPALGQGTPRTIRDAGTQAPRGTLFYTALSWAGRLLREETSPSQMAAPPVAPGHVDDEGRRPVRRPRRSTQRNLMLTSSSAVAGRRPRPSPHRRQGRQRPPTSSISAIWRSGCAASVQRQRVPRDRSASAWPRRGDGRSCAGDLLHAPASALGEPDEGCSPAGFRWPVDEPLGGPEPALDPPPAAALYLRAASRQHQPRTPVVIGRRRDRHHTGAATGTTPTAPSTDADVRPSTAELVRNRDRGRRLHDADGSRSACPTARRTRPRHDRNPVRPAARPALVRRPPSRWRHPAPGTVDDAIELASTATTSRGLHVGDLRQPATRTCASTIITDTADLAAARDALKRRSPTTGPTSRRDERRDLARRQAGPLDPEPQAALRIAAWRSTPSARRARRCREDVSDLAYELTAGRSRSAVCPP